MANERIALVTGAAGGIGQAVVARLVQDGFRVAGMDVDKKRMDELVPLVLKAESRRRKAVPTLNGRASRSSNASKTGKEKNPSGKSKRRRAKAKT